MTSVLILLAWGISINYKQLIYTHSQKLYIPNVSMSDSLLPIALLNVILIEHC